MAVTGCNKSSTANDGFCADGKAAMEKAKKNHQNILVIATMKDDDMFSTDFITNVLNDSKFKEEICTSYAVIHMDFSQSSYKETVYNNSSTEDEIKIAEEKAETMRKNTLLASRLNLQVTPAIYLMSEDMYFIEEVDYLTNEITNYYNFKGLLEKQNDIVNDFNVKVEATKTGSKKERLAAMDNLFESTDGFYRTFLIELVKEYIKLDSNDESGILSKYIMAKADIESANYFNAGDAGSAARIYEKVAEDTRLLPEYRQNAHYLTAYIMSMSQSTDYDKIIYHLNSAIEVYPEGENTASIKAVLTEMERVLSEDEAYKAHQETE